MVKSKRIETGKHEALQPTSVKTAELEVGQRYWTKNEIIPRRVLSVSPLRDLGYGARYYVESDSGPMEVGADVTWYPAP